jgi:hypothetical protein
MSYQSSGPSKPQPIPGAQTTPPPRRQSFFDWAMSFGSPGSAGNNVRPSSDLIEQAQAKQRSVSFGSNSGNAPMGLSSSPKSAFRPRTLAQSPITHDEALNLSRAGASNAAVAAVGSGNPGATSSQPGQGGSKRRESMSRHQRRNSKGNYEGLGLVAAFSGGPSSF